MIAIVDYGAGNLFSVKNACDFLHLETSVIDSPKALSDAAGIILPGVGAFPEAMHCLEEAGFVEPLKKQAGAKPLLGICLGMQMLFDYSTEFSRTEGLGLIPGHVGRLETGGKKLPHIGWNELLQNRPSPLTQELREGESVYFVHSFGAVCDERYVAAYTEYGCRIPALVQNGKVFGAQFHPEKSGDVGLAMLKQFGRLVQA